MNDRNGERPALLIIDMVEDNFEEEKKLPITPFAKEIVGPINGLSAAFRDNGWPVVFSTDSFKESDFIFTGRMKPHSLKGTPGAEVTRLLVRKPEDHWLPKPRFSAFFDTGLESWLRDKGVTLCAVTGIATNFCVLTTAMDALCHSFKTVIVEDGCAAFSPEIHTQTIGLYRRNPLYPLFRILRAEELLQALKPK